jgi:hypothetical protein
MKKLEAGMYVRTKYNDYCNEVAIRKITEIDPDDNKFWIDEYIIDTYGNEQNKLCEEDISKASNIAINLLEVGDYVNGYKVVSGERWIIPGKNGSCDKVIYVVINGGALKTKRRIYGGGIKTIVTHEQMDVMEYKVGD